MNSEQLKDDWGTWYNPELLAVPGSWKSLESLREFALSCNFLNLSRELMHCGPAFLQFLSGKIVRSEVLS